MSKEGFYMYVKPSIPELRAAIDSLKIYDATKRIALENAIDYSVKDMAKVARQKVPVDSGRLKKSIQLLSFNIGYNVLALHNTGLPGVG